ncbi:unnamed protein product [Effrenium voratum]|nr:unnamed protein product [Effrenium voratum]
MPELPSPATSPHKPGSAAICGRMLLMAALDASARRQAPSPTSPASPASPAYQLHSCGSSPARRSTRATVEDGEEQDGTEEQEQEQESEAKHAFGWYLIRSSLAGLVSPTRGGNQEKSPQSPLSPQSLSDRRDSNVDLIESMEEGHAHEITTDFIVPLRRSSKLWRFRVLRSDDKLSARLVTDAGDFLMYASVFLEAHRVDFHLYDPCQRELFDRERPAFTMGYNSTRDQWRLVQEQCAACQYASPHRSCASHGKQQVAIINHKQHSVGEGLSNVMEVIIPGLYQNDTCVVWCAMQGKGDLADAGFNTGETQTLVTRKPVWNEQVQSLVLDFKGRNIVSSAKNFQLALRQKPQHVICQYGKLSSTNFGLDFRYPLSVIQAFAAAMSTLFWT